MSWESYYNGKHVVVGGGLGFIGTHLCRKLLSLGVRSLKIVDPGYSGIYAADDILTNRRVYHVNTTLGSDKMYSSCFGVPDIFFNLAAKVANIEYNNQHNFEMFFANLDPIVGAVELAKRSRHYVFASTVCVYSNNVCSDSDVRVVEGDVWKGAPEPTNEGYGLAKLVGEHVAGYIHREYGVPVTIARFANAAGPGDHWSDHLSHVCPSFVKKALADTEEMVVWGSGEQVRTFVHPEDLSEGLLRLAVVSQDATPVNIAGEEGISIRELAEKVCDKVLTTKGLVFDTSRPDGHKYRVFDASLFRGLTGWSPEKGIDEILEALISEYRSGNMRVESRM